MWPQIIVIIFMGISIGIHLIKHGEFTGHKYSIWTILFTQSLNWFLLYSGGFFDVFFK